MSSKQKNKWVDMSHEERIYCLESFLNNKIQFSVKLLHDYTHQLQILEMKEKCYFKDVLEEAFKDRMTELKNELDMMIQFISGKQLKSKSFLQPTTDFGLMEPGVSE